MQSQKEEAVESRDGDESHFRTSFRTILLIIYIPGLTRK